MKRKPVVDVRDQTVTLTETLEAYAEENMRLAVETQKLADELRAHAEEYP